MSTVLLCRTLRRRKNRYSRAAFGFRCELNLSINEREQRVVFAHAYIAAGMPLRAALTRKHVAGENDLAAKRFQAEATACGVAAVA